MRGMLRFIFAVMVICGVANGASAQTASPDNNPGQLATTLKHADQLIKVERLGEALSLLETIDANTSRVAAKVDTLLGKIYLRLHKPAKAAGLFEQAVLSSMDDADAYLGLAKARLALGSLTQARQHARTAIRSNPDLISAHLVLARLDDRSGRISKARSRFTRLVQNQPDSEPVIVTYATFLAYRDDIAAATDLLAHFISRHPFAAEAGDLLGQLYWQQGRKAGALQTRAAAAKAFKAIGNDFRAKAIRSWLVANDPGGDYRLGPRKIIAPPTPAPKSEPKVQPAPAPVPVKPVEQAKLPAPPRPLANTPPVLERPRPLPFKQGVMLSTGSGFIVGGGRYVITNRHVIADTKGVAVRSGTGEVRKVRTVRIAPNDDLAILELAEPFPDSYAIPYGNMGDAGTGRAAVVMGYPLASLIGWRQPSLTEGIVSKESGLGDNPKTFQITSKMNKGNSGGPIFDHRGRLIGIAVAKLDTTKVYEKKGSLPEDVNIAIKASRLLGFLKHPASESGQPPPEISLEELYRTMLAKVVMVAAEMK